MDLQHVNAKLLVRDPEGVDLERVIPVITAIREKSGIPISIDTTKAEKLPGVRAVRPLEASLEDVFIHLVNAASVTETAA